MNTFYDEHNKSDLKMILGRLDEINPFNDKLQVVRVQLGQKFYDLHLSPSTEYPNSNNHLALVLISSDLLVSSGFTSNEETYNFAPGTSNNQGRPAQIINAIAYLVDKKQKISASNPKSGSSTFAIRDTDMASHDRVRISITPSTPQDYTSYGEQEGLGDPRSKNIGVFSNDKTVQIKGAGGAVTIGEEGIHFSGKIYWEHSKHEKEIMQDNMFNGFIPETIITFPLAIPYWPNFSKFLSLAEVAHQSISIVDKSTQINSALSRIQQGINT